MRLFVLLTTFSVVAQASIFSDWGMSGNCRKANVEILQNGYSLSMLFTDFGPNMPKGEQGDGKYIRKSCQLRVNISSPEGYYLESLRQVYSGGIIKSKGSRAHFTIRYQFGLIFSGPKIFGWDQNSEIDPSDTESVFVETFEDKRLPLLCRNTVRYSANLAFVGQRNNINEEYVIGGLDSVDAEVQEMRLEPTFKACQRGRFFNLNF